MHRHIELDQVDGAVKLTELTTLEINKVDGCHQSNQVDRWCQTKQVDRWCQIYQVDWYLLIS